MERVYRFDEAVAVLKATPQALAALLGGLPEPWVRADEGPGTWTAHDVIGHLIHGERTDWIPRVEHILEHGDTKAFPVFDREAMFDASLGMSLAELLHTFIALREKSLARLAELGLDDADLARPGLHPSLGRVTLGQHLSTWVVHDLDHVAQIVRVMGKRYAADVGPWTAYLSILGVRTQ